MRVWWRSRGVRKSTGGRRVRDEDELLDGHDLFAVAELLQLAEQGLDLLNEGLSLLALQLAKNLLCRELVLGIRGCAVTVLTDDIVAILVTHQAEQRTLTPLVGRCQRGDDVVSLALLAELDTLLNHIAGELVLGVSKELRHHDLNHAGPILLLAVLNDMLDDVVSKLVGDEVGSASMKLSQNGFTVHLFAVLQHSLDDTAAIGVCSEAVNLAPEGVDDELDILRGHTLDSLLNDMVAILVSHALEDVVLQLLDHGGLLVGEDVLEGLKGD